MKILYFTNNFPTPTAPQAGIFLLKRIILLQKMGCDVHVVTFSFTNQKLNYFKSQLKSFFYGTKTTISNYNIEDYNVKTSTILAFGKDGFPNFKFESLSVINYISELLYKEFIRSQSTIIHVQHLWYAYPAYLLKQKYGIPYVISLHGSDIHQTPFTSEQNKRDALMLLNNANYLLFVSDYLYQKAKQIGYNKTNYEVIPNGFDDMLFNLKNTENHSDSNTVGFVGNLILSKGTNYLPQIFKTIYTKIPHAKFIIVGDGIEKIGLQNELKTHNLLDRVLFTGYISAKEVAEQMKKMDVLVLPSENEGFGCVLIEAQACGVIVVASENGGTVEATKNTGVIIKNGENYATRFGEAVVYLLQNKTDKLEVSNSVKNYTWSVIVNKELEVYRKIISNNAQN